MTVSGTSGIPILGVLPDGEDVGVDITACPQFPKPMEFVFAAIQNMVAAAELQPFQASTGTGELHTVEVTLSPDHEVMIRFMVRTGAALIPLRAYLSILLEPLTHQRLPAKVVSVHVLEDGCEYALHGKYLRMQIDEVPLHVTANATFPTNPHVSREFFRQARAWADQIGANSVWSLNSGVGGLGLAMVRRHNSLAPRPVWGVEACEESVRAANITAHEMGYRDLARFVVGDANRLDTYDRADFLTVGEPSPEGLGPLAERLNASGPKHVLYFSAQPAQLAHDLGTLVRYRPLAARLFDVYPNTPHITTAILLERQ